MLLEVNKSTECNFFPVRVVKWQDGRLINDEIWEEIESLRRPLFKKDGRFSISAKAALDSILS